MHLDKARKKVLVIDDDKQILELYRIMLKKLGYRALVATNGNYGLKLLEEKMPEVVIVDLYLQGISGFDVIKYGKRFNNDTQFIVISGVGGMDDVIKALRFGAIDYINKPVDSKLLQHSIEKAFEKVKLLNENKLYQEKLKSFVK